jgi:translation initiation factor 5A
MADDGNSGLVQPCSAGDLKKGCVGMFKGRPAKVMEVSVSKTGKHGHAKCSITAIDIFTGKKITDVQPSHAHMYMANVTKNEYQVMSIDEKDKTVSVLDSDNNQLTIELDGEAAEDLVANFDQNDGDNNYMVTVTSGPVGVGSGDKMDWTKFDSISAWKKVKADA